MIWRKLLVCALLYGAIVGALIIACRRAPMDPTDPNTRDNEK